MKPIYFAGAALLGTMALAACDSATPPPERDPREAAAQSTPPAAIEVDGPERVILAFGDSLFAGYDLAEHEGYPEQLEHALRGRGINARVIDAGLSGDTSAAGRQRLAFTLEQQGAPPDLALLELGGNDLLRNLPPQELRANLAAMLGELRDAGIPTVLFGMRAPPNYGREYQQQFDAIYRELAAEYGTTLVPFFIEPLYDEPDLLLPDRVHPTAGGVAALVDHTIEDVARALPQGE